MPFQTRPIIMGRRGVVTAGHYLAASAGLRIMTAGGNAIDAAAAMGICLTLLEPQSCGIGGEVPTLIYSARERRTFAISGMGWSPKAFTIDWCRDHGIELIPGDGYLPACVPAVVDTWAVALARFGTMSFTEILQPAIELAENGFPVYVGLRNNLRASREKYVEQYPTTGAIYVPGGNVPHVGDALRNPDFGAMLRVMCRAEDAAKGRGRVAGIEAARDAFYRGEIAERIARFIVDDPVADASGTEHTALLTYEDLAEWRARVEDPVTLNYRGLDVYKCSSWTQGPVFLQQLAILQHLDLKAMGHNSADYLHAWIETAKLAFADREAYYGDPDFDAVPFDVLLSSGYGATRAGQIGPGASQELCPGDLGAGVPEYAARSVHEDNRHALGTARRAGNATNNRPSRQTARADSSHLGDTTHLDAVDAEGNMVAATPSGGWIGSSPVIAGLGFPLGTRGQMFYLNPQRPNALQPRKRPRATLTPTIVTRDGGPFLAFGTPGGDGQDQWTLQFFLNYVEFGMDLQHALDAATVHTAHFPSSFYPRNAYPGRVEAESRLPEETLAELRRRGHDLRLSDGWSHGKPLAIHCHVDRGLILGAATARNNIAYAMGW